MKQITLALAIILSLTACGTEAEVSADLDALTSALNNSSTRTCALYTGAYRIPSLANLAITQSGCSTVNLKQTCSSSYCSAAGIDSYELNLPLDGTEQSVGGATYSATFINDALVVVKKRNGVTTTSTYRQSSSPCDSNFSGLEINQVVDSGDTQVETCQAWMN